MIETKSRIKMQPWTDGWLSLEQQVRNICPRLHFDSRFRLYHVAVVLSFLRSQSDQHCSYFSYLCLFLADLIFH